MKSRLREIFRTLLRPHTRGKVPEISELLNLCPSRVYELLRFRNNNKYGQLLLLINSLEMETTMQAELHAILDCVAMGLENDRSPFNLNMNYYRRLRKLSWEDIEERTDIPVYRLELFEILFNVPVSDYDLLELEHCLVLKKKVLLSNDRTPPKIMPEYQHCPSLRKQYIHALNALLSPREREPLADHMGWSMTVLCRILKGEKLPTLPQMEQIMDYFNLTGDAYHTLFCLYLAMKLDAKNVRSRFNRQLRNIRVTQGLTLKKVSERIGIPCRRLERYENLFTVGLAMCDAAPLAAFMETTTAELLRMIHYPGRESFPGVHSPTP